MSVNRSEFLRRSGLFTLGLLTGDAALESFERLTWRRKYWPSADTGYRAEYRIGGGAWLPLHESQYQFADGCAVAEFDTPVTVTDGQILDFRYTL